jgi:hypothetical protein
MPKAEHSVDRSVVAEHWCIPIGVRRQGQGFIDERVVVRRPTPTPRGTLMMNTVWTRRFLGFDPKQRELKWR